MASEGMRAVSFEVMSYEWDLDVQLQTCIDNFELAQDRYWEERLNSGEWSALNQLRRDADEIAASIRNRAMTLQNVGDVSELNSIREAYLHEKQAAEDHYAELEALAKEKLPADVARNIVQAFRSIVGDAAPDPERASDRPLHLIWERLCTQDARDSITSIRDRVRRILRLERLIANVLRGENPPAASVEFLALVSRCYIFDFIPECVMVCRSAMEAAFRQKITDSHCKLADQPRKSFGYDLAAMIEAAFDPRNQLLDLQGQKVVKDAATRVRLRGKKAIHEQVDVTKDALGTLRDTLLVIGGLSRLPDPPESNAGT